MILVADDEPAIVEVIASTLEDEGHRVTTARDGQDALQLLREHQPCLAILDLMMPRLNGWQLRQAMLDDPELADIPVAVVTAFSGDIGDLHADAVLRKPFELAAIVDLAEHHCGAHTG